jgi:uncharacterized protein with HEPN domain
MSREPSLLVGDMIAACDLLRSFAAGFDRTSLAEDAKTVAAIERELFILGEAVKQLPPRFRDRHRDIEWRQIAGFRDVLAHTYWRIDPDVLWQTVTEDVPTLREQLATLAQTL